jgi:NDP-sugar pyrophosphorylase family protein
MRAHDPTVPKTLLEVAGHPFAHWQLRWLAAEGVESVVYSIGHMGNAIRDFVGDGAPWGVNVAYVDEGKDLRGTGGAVRLAADRGVVADQFFVLYGDSYLTVTLQAVADAFESRKLSALMTVLENAGQWDASNVIFDGEMVVEYQKGVQAPTEQMRYIDYGLQALDRHLVLEHIAPDEPSDLADFLSTLSQSGQLGGYEVFERFYEVGSPEGWRELDLALRAAG